MTTDADCLCPAGWLTSMAGRFAPGIGIVQGPKRIRGNGTWLSRYQEHEVFGLVSVEAASFALGKPMILSTGTSTLAEVEEALEVCVRAGNDEVALLHCTLKYPCPPEGINLRMMEHLMRAFPQVPVGLSDHSLGISVPQAAVALGATIVEKHYTVDKTLRFSH